MSLVYRTSTLFLVSICCSLLIPAGLRAQGVNHAALIGVGAYPASTGWAALSSANDLELITATLEEIGFSRDNIQTLKDEQATHDGIVTFLTKTVKKQLKKGDVLMLHFSGHGQQARDDNGDEDDQLDECWVPIDSPKDFTPGVYEGEHLLRDDEIGSILADLLKTLGPEGHLFLSVDACHSGTSTRGLGTARGTDQIMGDSAFVAGFYACQTPGKSQGAKQELVTSPEQKNLVVFTSSSPHQLSYEQARANGQFGAYSYELCRSLRTMNPKGTVGDLFGQVESRIGNLGLRQRPTAEGDLKQKVFNGRLTPPVPAFRIAEVLSDKTIRLAAGDLQGVYPGSLMALYPAGTSDTSAVAPVVRGNITASTAITADMALNQAVDQARLKNLRAYLVYPAPPPLDLSIHLRNLEPATEQMMQGILKDYPFIEAGPLPSRLIVEDESDSVFLWTPDDRLIWSDRIKPSNRGWMVKAIKQHVEASAMRHLATDDPDYRATVVLQHKTSDGWKPFDGEEVPEGTLTRFEVKNVGSTTFYFSIVDVQPNDKVEVLVPSSDQDGESFKLGPGERWKSPNFNIAPPYGAETVKIICTDKPIRLNQISGTRGIPTQSHALELLFAASFPEVEGTRGIKVDEPPAGRGSVQTLNFRITRSE